MRNLFYTLVLLFFSINSALACCATPLYTLSEILLNSQNNSILFVKVKDVWSVNNRHMQVGGDIKSSAIVIEAFGKQPKYDSIIISSGSIGSSAGCKILKKDAEYLIISESRDGINYYGFVCDPYSCEKINISAEQLAFGEPIDQPDNYKIVKEYFHKVKTKYTGYVVIGNNGVFLAEGNMMNGKPIGKWINYLYKRDGEKFVKSLFNFNNGKLDGISYNIKSINGKDKLIENTYDMGKLIRVRYIDDIGELPTIETTFQYKQNHEVSKRIVYNKDHSIQKIETKISFYNLNDILPYYKNSVLSGEFELHYENGKIKEKGHYWYGAKIGEWNYYNDDGSFKEKVKYNKPSIQDDLFTIFFADGTIKIQGELLNNIPNGVWNHYDKNGNLIKKTIYKNGVKDGRWIEYFLSGEIYSITNYRDGQKEGKYIKYYENKMIMESGQYKNNLKSSIWIKNNQAGSLIEEVNYVNGIENGKYKRYNQDGTTLIISGVYRHGRKCGQWKEYDEMKKYYRICDFDCNKPINFRYQEKPKCIFKDLNGNILNQKDIYKRKIFHE